MAVNPLEHLGLVAYWAKRCGARHPVKDSEQFADGCVGLLRAIELFDDTRGVKFATFATYHIRMRILYSRNLERRRLAKAGLTSTVAMSELVQQVAATGSLPDEEAEVTDEHSHRKLMCELLLTTLDPRSREVLFRRFFLGQTLKEVGKLLGLTRERIRQIEGNALKALRKREQDVHARLRALHAH
jgi:RNA polymerase sigma factor (sigma-70 family)